MDGWILSGLIIQNWIPRLRGVAGVCVCVAQAPLVVITSFARSLFCVLACPCIVPLMTLFRSSLRQLSTMSASHPVTSSPFTRAVVNSMRKMYVVPSGSLCLVTDRCRRYPEALADKSFDNTGCKLVAGNTMPCLALTTLSTPRSTFQPQPTTEEFRPIDNRPHQSRRRRSYQAAGLGGRSLPYANAISRMERT